MYLAKEYNTHTHTYTEIPTYNILYVHISIIIQYIFIYLVHAYKWINLFIYS